MDIEQRMSPIVEQQAKFETDIAEIYKSLTRTNETAQTHNEAIRGLVEVSRLRSERIDRLDQTLADSYDRLARAQKGIDRRLKDLIAQVSRYAASGNGGKRGPGAPGSK